MDLNERIEIGPGLFKRLADCTANDLEASIAVGDERMRLLRRELELSAIIIDLARDEHVVLAEEINDAMLLDLARADAGLEVRDDRDLLAVRRTVELLEASAAANLPPQGVG